jgi:hypothetical protein
MPAAFKVSSNGFWTAGIFLSSNWMSACKSKSLDATPGGWTETSTVISRPGEMEYLYATAGQPAPPVMKTEPRRGDV